MGWSAWRRSSTAAAHPSAESPPRANGTRGDEIWTIHPMRSAPIGVLPNQAICRSAMTRPCIAGSVACCSTTVSTDWNDADATRLAAVVGILMFTGEAQHGTLAVTLTARPTRWVMAAAKTVTATSVGLTLGVTGMIAGFGGAALGGAALGSGSALTSRPLWALLYIALASLIGLGVGMIAHHTAGAITGLLMWSFVLESLFAPAIPEGGRHFLPFSAGYRLLDAGPNFEPPVTISHLLDRPEYALIFAGYTLVSLGIGNLLLYRRDSE